MEAPCLKDSEHKARTRTIKDLYEKVARSPACLVQDLTVNLARLVASATSRQPLTEELWSIVPLVTGNTIEAVTSRMFLQIPGHGAVLNARENHHRLSQCPKIGLQLQAMDRPGPATLYDLAHRMQKKDSSRDHVHPFTTQSMYRVPGILQSFSQHRTTYPNLKLNERFHRRRTSKTPASYTETLRDIPRIERRR